MNIPSEENMDKISDIGTLVSIDPTEPAVLMIFDNNLPLVTIHPNGAIEYGPNYTPDEASRIFWEALGAPPKLMDDIAEKVERIERDFARLDSKYGKDWTEWMDVRESIGELRSLVIRG